MRVQVKARTVGTDTRRNAKFSAFRSWDFHKALFITFDAVTYDVTSAVMVPSTAIQQRALFSGHTNAFTVTLGTDLLGLSGADDVTELILAGQERADLARSKATVTPGRK